MLDTLRVGRPAAVIAAAIETLALFEEIGGAEDRESENLENRLVESAKALLEYWRKYDESR